jgi:hypothetical protein
MSWLLRDCNTSPRQAYGRSTGAIAADAGSATTWWLPRPTCWCYSTRSTKTQPASSGADSLVAPSPVARARSAARYAPRVVSHPGNPPSRARILVLRQFCPPLCPPSKKPRLTQLSCPVQKPPICSHFVRGERWGSNPRPPGPQPEGWGTAQVMRPEFIGFLACGCCSVLLSLFPVLFPEHLFAAVGGEWLEPLSTP